MKYNTLDEALNDLGWFHLDNIKTDNRYVIDSINEFFNPNNLNSENVPEITANQKTIIICDNSDFNETYLIDLVSEVLKEHNVKPGDYQLVLLDNVCGRLYIDNPKFIQYIKQEDIKALERGKLFPQVIVINPETNVIVNVSETIITQITKEMIEYLIKYLDNDFKIEN